MPKDAFCTVLLEFWYDNVWLNRLKTEIGARSRIILFDVASKFQGWPKQVNHLSTLLQVRYSKSQVTGTGDKIPMVLIVMVVCSYLLWY